MAGAVGGALSIHCVIMEGRVDRKTAQFKYIYNFNKMVFII